MINLRICLDVDNLERAIAFYTGAFELKVGRRFDQKWVELIGAQAPIDLLETKEGSSPFTGATALRTFERHWCPVHLDFVVADLEKMLSTILALGAKLERPVREEPYGRLANLADPFGHGICLLQMNERGYDALV